MSNMVSYFKRIADAVEKLAEESSSDESTTTGVEIYAGYVGMHNSSLGIGSLLKFEQEMRPEYSDFVVPMFVPGSEDTEDVRGLEVAFFKKVDDTTGDVSYVTFFYVDQRNPRVNVYGDIAIEASVLYNSFVYLEVSKVPEPEDEVLLQILPQIG